MPLLIAGLLVFLGIHLLPSAVPAKAALVGRLGPQRYKGLFSLVALAGFALIVYGKAHAPFIPVWQPPPWARHFALAVMPFALMLLASSHMKSNVKRVTRHPMLWGVLLWALAHLAANGDLASILLFGGFAVYAPFAMWSANRRGAKLADRPQPPGRDAMVVVAGLVAYAALLVLHPVLFGVSPLR